jgi:hypothetical protein
MKDRAEFTGKVRDVGKRAAHTVGGTYGTLCLTPCECCGEPPRFRWRRTAAM